MYTALALQTMILAYPALKPEPLPEKAPGYLGVAFSFDEQNQRAVILSVHEGSPAKEGGLRSGDAICSINGRKLDKMEELTARIASCRPSSVVPILVVRDGENVTLRVRVGYRPEGSNIHDPDALVCPMIPRIIINKEEEERQTGVREYDFEME